MDPTYGRYIIALEAKQVELAVSAMNPTSGHDAFAYGRAVGIFAGLQMAIDILNDIHRDQAAKDGEL